jgi:hypothetical protein
MLVANARYFSDLIEGDVPILAPREVVDASVGINRATVEGKFRSGDLYGDKTAGNQWRIEASRGSCAAF